MSVQPADAQDAHDELTARLKRTEVQRSASSIPSREIVQVITEIPAGVESGWHSHPGEEVGYLLAGTVQMMIEDRPTLVLHAGMASSSRPTCRTTRSTSGRRRG